MYPVASKDIRKDGIYFSIIELKDNELDSRGETHHIDAFGISQNNIFFEQMGNFDSKIRGLKYGGLGSLLTFYSKKVLEPRQIGVADYTISYTLTSLTASYQDKYSETNIICVLYNTGQVDVQTLTKDNTSNLIEPGWNYLASFISHQQIQNGLSDGFLENLLPIKKKQRIWDRFKL